jgi:hypothetical protein
MLTSLVQYGTWTLTLTSTSLSPRTHQKNPSTSKHLQAPPSTSTNNRKTPLHPPLSLSSRCSHPPRWIPPSCISRRQSPAARSDPRPPLAALSKDLFQIRVTVCNLPPYARLRRPLCLRPLATRTTSNALSSRHRHRLLHLRFSDNNYISLRDPPPVQIITPRYKHGCSRHAIAQGALPPAPCYSLPALGQSSRLTCWYLRSVW